MVKIGEKSRHFKSVELLVVEGVARRAEDIFFLEVAADLVRAVDWDGRLVEEVQKPLFKRGAVGLDAEGLEDAVPAEFKSCCVVSSPRSIMSQRPSLMRVNVA